LRLSFTRSSVRAFLHSGLQIWGALPRPVISYSYATPHWMQLKEPVRRAGSVTRLVMTAW